MFNFTIKHPLLLLAKANNQVAKSRPTEYRVQSESYWKSINGLHIH